MARTRSYKAKPATAVTPRSRGRPRLELDTDLLAELAGIQCTLDEMASILGCSVDTLQRHEEFAAIIAAGRVQGRMSVRRTQYALAMSGDKTMLIWLGKQWLGQRDQASVETRELPPLIVGLYDPEGDAEEAAGGE